MKIELVLSGTYLHAGKVYQKVDQSGKRLAYTVPEGVGNHLIEQRNERDIPYFRMVSEATPAHLAAAKRHEKGGKIEPEPDAPDEPAADEPAAAAPVADEPAADASDEADEDEDITLDDVTEEENEDAVTL